MKNIMGTVLLGMILGTAMTVPVRLICALLLKKRCLREQIEKKHLLILTMCLAVTGGAIGWRVGMSLRAMYLLLLAVVAACAFTIDAIYRIIPNELILSVVALTAAFGLAGAIPFDFISSLIGLAACFLIFFIPGVFGQKIGAGDVKLAAAMGFALGFRHSLYAIAGMGTLVLIYVLFMQGTTMAVKMKKMIPMGPFLSVALVVVSAL